MNTLEKICAQTLADVTLRRAQTPLHMVEQVALRATPPRGFHHALQTRVASRNPAFICEIKKASPSAGLIRPDFSPAQHAVDYAAAGASCLSVLTDTPFFQGTPEHLMAARAACHLPVLRKDFMLSEYQIFEARAMGADCILIIMAALSVHEAQSLEKLALQLGMDVLIEVHDQRELELALGYLRSPLVGINNRNLATLEVTLATSEQLRPLIPEGYTVVCESGIKTHHDVQRMQRANMHVFLVGESLMKQPNIGRALRQLRGAPC